MQFNENSYRPLPSNLTLKDTDKHGFGIFATEDIKAGVFLGITHVWFREEWIRTPIGGFINHSEEPNCFINTQPGRPGRDPARELYSIKPISQGDELTVYYTLEEYYD